MARPREFDEAEATEAAMNVFWQHGYDAATIALLMDGMGMTKGSLYKAFADKKSLFLESMARYETAQVASAIALLRDPNVPDGHDRIAQVFRTVPKVVRQGDRRGCLLCSAAAGPAFYDREIADLVDGLLDDMRAAFDVALEATIPQPDARAAMAHLLLTQYVGLRTLSRAQARPDDLERSVEALLALIDRERARAG
jgi:TetR/AcrR family transcriptional repressor of nem operon